jgi:endonuclease-3 related protein
VDRGFKLTLLETTAQPADERSSKKGMRKLSPEHQVASIYSTLFQAWGRQHWWPARSRFEVIVGAYLTQNTSWSNVEIAMRKLRSAGVLNLTGIRKISIPKLEQLIRSSGYFRQKAARLKLFVKSLDENHGGSLTRMFAQPTAKLREELLALNGVGPETADSILLYAGQHPIFVVDAYTRRMAARHEIVSEKASYDEIRTLFERGLAAHASTEGVNETTPDSLLADGQLLIKPEGTSHKPSRMSVMTRVPLAQVFNEMHGLIVGVGKIYCSKSQPKCDQCPLKGLLPASSSH